MKKLIFVLAILFVIPFSLSVAANPIDGQIFQYSGNGHYYSWINHPVTWDLAKTEAENFTTIFDSVLLEEWHLATITSQGEQDFLVGTVLDLPNSWQGPIGAERAWIGLTNIISTTNFEWITGESISYSNWYPGEPNNPLDTVGTLGRYSNGGWNNEGIFDYSNAYLIEHSTTGTPVPEPNTMFLLSSGFLGVIVVSRKIKCKKRGQVCC